MIFSSLIIFFKLNVWEEMLKSDILEAPTEEYIFETLLTYVKQFEKEVQYF